MRPRLNPIWVASEQEMAAPPGGTGIALVSAGALHENGTPAFGQVTTAGNLLVAWVTSNSSSATFDTTCTGTGWAAAGHGGGAFEWVSIWYRENCGATEAAPTFSSGGSDMWAQLAEFSGAATSGVLDQTATGPQAQDWSTSFTSPDAEGGELVTAAAYWNGSNSGGAVTIAQAGNLQRQFTDSNGGTITGTLTQAANGGVYAATLYGVAGIAGSQPHTIRFALSVQASGEGVAATFKPASPVTAVLTAATTSLPGRFTGVPYQGTNPVAVSVTGGTPPYTWSVTAGSLPAGLLISSSTGHITGTPTTAGTSNFTVQVADSDSATVSIPLSIVITAAPTVVFTSTATGTTNDFGTWVVPSPDPEFTGIGPPQDVNVNNNVWGPVTSPPCTQTISVQSAHQWYIAANYTDPSAAVHSFPNTGTQFPLAPPVPWQTLQYLVSGWDVYLDTDSDIVASACYDLWFDQAYIGQTSGVAGSAELMAHFSLRNRGDATYASGLQFGGYNAGGYDIPATVWSLSYRIGDGAAYFNLGNPPGTYSSMDTGALDWKPMFQYVVDQGFLPASAQLKGFSLGFEVCATNGNTNSFVYNDAWWHAIA
jgi:hypothetical protein